MKLDVALPVVEHPSASASLEHSCGPALLFYVSFISLAETFLLRGRGLTLIIFAEYFVLSSFHSRLRLFCCRFDSLFITFPIGDELAMLSIFSVKWSATSPTLYS